jgi:flagella basal body P-ring formation protein FlgA
MVIMTDVRTKLHDQMPYLLQDSVHVDVQNASDIVALHPEAVTASVDWVVGRYQLMGRSILPILLMDAQGRQVGRYGAVAEVTALAPLLETTRMLSRGEIVTSSDFSVRVSDAQAQPMGALRMAESAVGNEIVTTLPAETVLTEAMVRGVPDVRRGTLVRGVLTREDLRFELRGEALSDAKIGQKIKIRLQIGARRVVEGHVVDAKTVLLD